MISRFHVVSEVKDPFLRVTVRAKKLRPALRAAVDAWRDVGKEEFSRQGWFLRTGGFRAWRRTKQPFGDLPASRSILQRSGRLLASYLSSGISFSQGSAEFGSLVPYAQVHRRGAVIPVTPRSRAFLHYAGVHLRLSTTVLRIPARPHFQASREVRKRIGAVFANYLIEGKT